jgi:hypothetical protein
MSTHITVWAAISRVSGFSGEEEVELFETRQLAATYVLGQVAPYAKHNYAPGIEGAFVGLEDALKREDVDEALRIYNETVVETHYHSFAQDHVWRLEEKTLHLASRLTL